MSDPKIKVGADMSAVEKELGRLDAAAQKVVDTLSNSSVGLDVKQAKADLNALNDAAKDVADNLSKMKAAPGGDFSKVAKTLERAADAGESLEKVLAAVGQSTGMDKSIRGSKQIADNLERARRAQEVLTQSGIKLSQEEIRAAKVKFDEWRTSGARGTSKLRGMEFDDWLGGGYRKHSIDAAEAERNRRKILDALGVSPGGGAMGGARRMFNGRFGGAMMGAMGGVGMSVMSGGDGMFSAMGGMGGTMIGGAMGMVAGGPVGAAAGVIAAKALGSIGGILDQSMQRVMAEANTLTNLRHSLGKTSTDFEELRSSVRSLSSNLRLTNDEAARLAATFVAAAGQTMSAAATANGMHLSGGFSRSFGIDPSQNPVAAMFFGSMRRMGASGSDSSDRRLALMIAEAVAKNGVTPQVEAVLRAVQTFTENETRLSFTQANASGYTDFLSSMMGTGLAGSKDVTSDTSAMAAADAALRQGGAFGQASKVFSLGMYQRMLPGFNAFDLSIMNDQGAFGTVRNAFGKGSAAYQFAQSRGDKAAMGKYSRWSAKGGDTPIIDLQMRSLEQYYGGNTDMLRTAIMGQFGVTAGQAEQLYKAYRSPGGLGVLQKQLRAAGVDVSKVNPKAIGDLAEISGMGAGALHGYEQKLLGDSGVSAADKKAIQSASHESLEKQRETVMRIVALNDTQKDQGEILDQQKKTIDRLTDAVTTKLIPFTMAIRDGVIALASKFVPGYNAPASGGASGGGGGGWGIPGLVTFHHSGGGGGIHDSSVPDPAKMSPRQREVMRRIKQYAKDAGASDEETSYLLGLSWKESKFRNVYGPSVTHKVHGQTRTERAHGPFQVMDSTAEGWGVNIGDMDATMKAEIREQLRYYRRFGARGAAIAQLSGAGNVGAGGMPKNNRSDGYENALDFSDDVLGYANGFRGLFNPSAYRSGGQFQFQHTITLNDQYGNPVKTQVVSTHMGPPVPAGASIA